MKPSFSWPLLAVIVTLFLSGCNKNPDAEVVAVLQQNAQAAQSESLTAYMNTYHSQAPGRQMLQSMMRPLFLSYNLKYTVSDVQIESRTGDEIRAYYTLLTQKADETGPPFRNNRTGQQVILKKENGQWKIYEGEVKKIEYVD